MDDEKSVVFFDGVCKICNVFVNFLILRSDEIFFSSLQSDFAKRELVAYEIPDSMVFKSKTGELYLRSEAVLRIIYSLGGLWKAVVVFYIFPVRLRDVVYNLFARNRYRWFGKRDTCRLSSADEKARFLE